MVNHVVEEEWIVSDSGSKSVRVPLEIPEGVLGATQKEILNIVSTSV